MSLKYVEVSWKFNGNFSGNVMECQRNIMEMSGKFPGNARIVFGNVRGNVPEMSRKVPGKVKFQGIPKSS